jgi:hypothetical protein
MVMEKRVVLVLVLLFLCFTILASLVFATSLAPVEIQEITREADSIVIGTVEEVSSAWDEEGKLIYTEVEVDVETQLKGNDEDTLHVKSLGGEVGGVTLIVPGSPVFEEAQEVMLFVEEVENEQEQKGVQEETFEVVGLSEGKFDVVTDEEGNTMVETSSEQGTSLFSEHQEQASMPYEDFIAIIQNEIQQSESESSWWKKVFAWLSW